MVRQVSGVGFPCRVDSAESTHNRIITKRFDKCNNPTIFNAFEAFLEYMKPGKMHADSLSPNRGNATVPKGKSLSIADNTGTAGKETRKYIEINI
jgi:hypothetical protein